MTDIFKDILPSILQTKKNVLEEEKDYVPFVVNRALSYHYDCVLFVNEMNLYPGLDRTMQYSYLLNSIRGYRRPFQKWQKRETVESLELIKRAYSFSNEKAKEALAVLTDDQINEIKNNLDKGGVSNARTKRINRGNSS